MKLAQILSIVQKLSLYSAFIIYTFERMFIYDIGGIYKVI